jgi:hypothetical protein
VMGALESAGGRSRLKFTADANSCGTASASERASHRAAVELLELGPSDPALRAGGEPASGIATSVSASSLASTKADEEETTFACGIRGAERVGGFMLGIIERGRLAAGWSRPSGATYVCGRSGVRLSWDRADRSALSAK